MPDRKESHIDMMIHVDNAAAKPRLAAKIAECAGVISPRVKTDKPNLLFVSYDLERFDIRSVPKIAHTLGIAAQIVEI